MAQPKPRLERIDQLTAPPIPGRFYLVPLVHGRWYKTTKWWPVMGEKHEDRKFFNFPLAHYHLDRRFLPPDLAHYAVAAPLHDMPEGTSFRRRGVWQREPAVTLSEVRWGRRVCHTDEMYFPTHPPQVKALQESLAGAQCQQGDAGWICPHRRFALGSIAPDHSGAIVCPLHGLRIDAQTGIVLSNPCVDGA